MNTQFANIATPNEVVVSATFNIEIGSATGDIHFCMPYAMIEPIRDTLASSLQGELLGVDKRWIRLMTQQIKSAEIELIANLAKTKLSLEEVMNMKEGDVIPLSLSETVEATVDNVPVMECKYGLFNGQYALRVEQLLKANSNEDEKGETNGD